MSKYPKILLIILALFMLISCSKDNYVTVGSTVDIDDFKRPENVIKYQWSFDTKPPTSRLDPRDFIPSNYHPNVTFIPDQAGKYIVRLNMITSQGDFINKNFTFNVEGQANYLSTIETEKKPDTITIIQEKPIEKLPPKIVEVPVIKEKVIHQKTTISKTPNQWKTAPLPGQDPNEVKEEAKYITETKTEVIDEKGKIVGTDKTTHINAKYTLQIASSRNQANANELLNRLKKDGYDAFIQTAVVKGDTYYRIRIGHFETYKQANSYKQHLINTSDYEPWVDRL
ncbi:MAG: SPOR domain-containing protein [Candidatus Neomarinimicrobiota bacterium]|jgi:cell division septation protein DedD